MKKPKQVEPKPYPFSIWTTAGKDALTLVRSVHGAALRGDLAKLEIKYLVVTKVWGESTMGNEMIAFAKQAGIRVVQFSSLRFKTEMRLAGNAAAENGDESLIEKWRKEHDRALLKQLKSEKLPPVKIGLLLGYMWWTSKILHDAYDLLNLHPSLPPSYPTARKGSWQEVILQNIMSEDIITGVMMHLVAEQRDAGPVVSYCHFPIQRRRMSPLLVKAKDLLLGLALTELKKETAEKGKSQTQRTRGEEERQTAEKKKEEYPFLEIVNEIRQNCFPWEIPLIMETLRRLALGVIVIQDRVVYVAREVQREGVDLTEMLKKAV